MSRRRVGTASPRPDDPASAPWAPVALVRVDLDGPDSLATLSGTEGTRSWLEVVHAGTVVGLVEALPGHESSTRDAVAALALDGAAAEPGARDPVADEALASACVVVPTICANPDQLVRTVDALAALDHPDFEVIVVDNRPDPSAAPMPPMPGGARVRVIAEPRPGISAARNAGIAAASSDVVAFTDDDAVAEPGWLRAIGERFAREADVEAVGGLVLPLELDTEAQLWFEEFYGGFSRSFRPQTVSVERMAGTDPLFPYAPGRFGAGCNMAFRRETLVRLGGFDTSLGVGTPAKGGEDLAMFVGLLTAGGTVAFEPAAVVRHAHRRTQRAFLRQVRGYGTGLTAMYTSMVVHDPRHLAEMLRRLPAGVALLARPRADRSPSRKPTYPRRALAYQVLGMAYGPVAYARSTAAARRGT